MKASTSPDANDAVNIRRGHRLEPLAQHARLKIDAGVQVYFCDPQSPWQRGTNLNTNGLLRQYFPKGTDLSAHSAEEIAAVAATLNSRPRKMLGWKTPAEALDEWLAVGQQNPCCDDRLNLANSSWSKLPRLDHTRHGNPYDFCYLRPRAANGQTPTPASARTSR